MGQEATYPLAPQGVFWTLQGEGVMSGEPQVFVRLAGCPVGCPECDTDYRVSRRVTAREIAREVAAAAVATNWVWLTGGEPTVHDLPPLVAELHRYGFRVAIATAGVSPVLVGCSHETPGGVDFVSVSPHRVDESWVQRSGDQLNVVPGLNGLRLSDLEGVNVSGFAHRFVTPVWYGPGERMERISECVEFVRRNRGWRLGNQSHKHWGLA